MEDTTVILCKCGEPSDGWPDDLCQMCWEEECNKSWWLAMAGPPPAPEEKP